MPGKGILQKARVLRTLTNDVTVDTALKHIYDRLDDLQPDIAITGSPILNYNALNGSTILAKNSDGDYLLGVKVGV